MKREFLTELGLEKEAIDKIMAEHGKDIETEKTKVSATLQQAELDRDNYKGQLETAQTALKGFEGVNVKELQGKIQTLTTDLSTKETEYQSKLADIAFNSIIEKALSDAGAKNSKAVMALLDINSLKESKDQTADIKVAIEKAKKESDYLFGSNEPINNPVGVTPGVPIGDITKESFAKMGYKERLELKQKSPEKYKELKGE